MRLSRTGEDSFARALPSWPHGPGAFTEPADDDRLLARWQVASATLGPVAFGCRLCTARRTGQASRAMRYLPRWERVCGRHQRWLLDAAGGHELEHLDLAGSPQVWAAQRRWAGVARRAAQAGADPERVFAMARAVVCQWWEQALGWDQETVWPARLHQVAGGDAGPRFWWWRAVARDAVTFPETVTVARALADPAVQERVWADHGGGGPVRAFRPDGTFGSELAARLGRPWMTELPADYSGALGAWMGAVVRSRFHTQHDITPTGWPDNPWFLKKEHRPVPVAVQLRNLAEYAERAAREASATPVRLGRTGDAAFTRVAYMDRRGRRAVAYYRRPAPADAARGRG